MKKILGLVLGAISWINVLSVYAADKFEILPDLPEPLAAAQASSISTSSDSLGLATQSVGQQINFGEVIISLVVVILLIYASVIIISRLNKFNFALMKKQMRDIDNSRVSVISTTSLGNNKTLHVVELDGKRMLLGASTNSIDLIKDLGTYPPPDIEEGEFSKIEIPNIRIPKIEIPKIEFPNIGFTRAVKKNINDENQSENKKSETVEDNDNFVISDIYEESSDGIIDKLFTPHKQEKENEEKEETKDNNTNKLSQNSEHIIDPEEYALYKKYL